MIPTESSGAGPPAITLMLKTTTPRNNTALTTVWSGKETEPVRKRSCSFENAMTLPAKLTHPIRTPRSIVVVMKAPSDSAPSSCIR